MILLYCCLLALTNNHILLYPIYSIDSLVNSLVTEKNVRFTNRNWDLKDLSQRIVSMLDRDDWMTQMGNSEKGTLIQAKKENFLRDIITADRALSILVVGEPNDFRVTIGIGKWAQNLSVAAVETILTGGLILLVDIPEMMWNAKVENEVLTKITAIVESKQATLIPVQ
jgi:hypothetical protein